MLKVTNLSVAIGPVPIIRDASLDLVEGEMCGLIGRNGAGKTTFLRALMGAIPATGKAELSLHARIKVRLPGGRFPIDAHPVVFHHLPIVDKTWDHDDAPEYERDEDFLIWAYEEMLTVGAPRFAKAFEVLAGPNALPAVFHCAAGKDRTGLLAALLLGSLGVSQADILADYALTVEGMARFREWAAREWPEWTKRMASIPPAYSAALPEAMGHILDGLRAEHGSIRAYVRSIGVTESTSIYAPGTFRCG